MILVTVGTHTDGFPRLVQEMDRIAGQIDEEVLMQIGSTTYEPRAARWFGFTTQQGMDRLCKQARVIVSHAGAGSILTALRHGRTLVVMPRRQRYGEVVDDHQLELADALARAGALLVAYDTDELGVKLHEAECFAPRISRGNCLIEAVRRATLADVNETS